MKKKTKKPIPLSESRMESSSAEKKFVYYLPPGVKFGDVYMDALQIQQELNYGPRSIRDMRNDGLLSYTLFHKRV